MFFGVPQERGDAGHNIPLGPICEGPSPGGACQSRLYWSVCEISAELIAKKIAKRLGSTAILIETKITDIVKELQDRRARQSEPPTSTLEPDRTPEILALEAELMQKHWDAWIDTKVPALGNRTPRQAAKTAAGRERLEALLSDFARSEEQKSSVVFQADLGNLRRRLGLA